MPKPKTKSKDEKKELHIEHDPTLMLTMRFLTARPDLVSAFIMGVKGVSFIYKEKHKAVVTDFLDICENQFFNALRDNFQKRYPDMKIEYTYGTICKNGRGEERLIVGIRVEEGKKPSYEYIGDGKIGECGSSSMQGWMEKR